MTPAERQYRRVLRLLPADYRERWEEDMVSAYLDSVSDGSRRSAGEWLAVAWLALRLRLSGSHASPRARLWYQTALGIAMLTTLYEALDATSRVANLVGGTISVNVDVQWPNHVAYWWETLLLVWVAAFACLVLGRLVAARVLVLVALLHELGLTSLIVAHTLSPSWWGLPPREFSTMNQAWLVLTAVAVFLVPRDFRPSRAWLAAYLVPAAVLLPVGVVSQSEISRELASSSAALVPPQWLQQLSVLNVGTFLHVGVIAGMAIALLRARQWLLPLAVFGGAVATVQLLGYHYGYRQGSDELLYRWWAQTTTFWTGVNVVQLVLAVACVVVGLVAVRRARQADGRPDAS